MFQLSLRDYFAGIRAIMLNSPELLGDSAWVLPVRHFNPASLITRKGLSVIAQLMRSSQAIIIEDLDLDPASLCSHMEQFRLGNIGAIHLVDDGFRTEAFHYVVARREITQRLKGKQIW